MVFPTYDEISHHKLQSVVPDKLVSKNQYIQFIHFSFDQVEFKNELETVVGLGFEYRESLELSVKRLFAQLSLESGKLLL